MAAGGGVGRGGGVVTFINIWILAGFKPHILWLCGELLLGLLAHHKWLFYFAMLLFWENVVNFELFLVMHFSGHQMLNRLDNFLPGDRGLPDTPVIL